MYTYDMRTKICNSCKMLFMSYIINFNTLYIIQMI